MATESRRPKRVAEAVRATVAEALTEALSDPVLSGVVVMDVTVSDDLQVARIGVRRMVDDGKESSRQRVVQHLDRAAGRIRRLLAPRLDLRKVPELKFYFDVGPDNRARVDALLREIAEEQTGKPEEKP
ncbi:MAG TPA: 30S ribosome-binding factor RbfA [Polyangiaceae bacterium]|nr:30S ribosome-binding factor RbfA [Polyangiaceae bacterium]